MVGNRADSAESRCCVKTKNLSEIKDWIDL